VKLVDSRTGIEWIEERECLRLLASQEVGRLGFVAGGNAEILPINYALDGTTVVFATGPGTKLAGAATGSAVVFEIDGVDLTTRSGWSVIIHGTAYELTVFDRPSLVERVRSLELHPWAGDKPYIVRIEPRSITGRRVGPDPLTGASAAAAQGPTDEHPSGPPGPSQVERA